jgi:F-type H+-transporting ATPase subunit gamma
MESLSRKIASAGDLESVVRSMKALAASSIGQYEKAVESLHDYDRTVRLGLAACLRQPDVASPATKQDSQNVETNDAVIFGSDQGLVGRFNETLLAYAKSVLATLPGTTKRIWVIGERLRALVDETGAQTNIVFSVPTSVHAITRLVGEILIAVEAQREQGGAGRVYVFHNQPTAGAVYEPIGKQLLPLDRDWEINASAQAWPTKQLPQVMGDAAATLRALIREYLFVVLFQACAESLASENASRLAAMQRAEKNIEGILDDLNRKYHRVRQESIDEELFDVIAGYEALATKKNASARNSAAAIHGLNRTTDSRD